MTHLASDVSDGGEEGSVVSGAGADLALHKLSNLYLQVSVGLLQSVNLTQIRGQAIVQVLHGELLTADDIVICARQAVAHGGTEATTCCRCSQASGRGDADALASCSAIDAASRHHSATTEASEAAAAGGGPDGPGRDDM